MTDPNTRIAAAMEADPEWQKWATVPCEHWVEHSDLATGAILGEQRKPKDCPHCHGTGSIPRDFADPSNTMKLVEWAAKQTWWTDGEFNHAPVVRMRQVWVDLCASESTPAQAGIHARDIIAARLKEIHDGTP